jgi:hydroxyethylthiazole kinase-like uncharacterized protein yjeF
VSPPSPLPGWPPRDAEHLLVRAEQMASLEEALFASGLPVEALMEKAALAVARRLQQEEPPGPVLVLVGPGHNGGDGLVVARELHLAGWPVRIWCPWSRLKPLTEAHRRHAAWLGIPALEGEPDPADPVLWIDALFGVGQNRRLEASLEDLLERRQRQRPGRLLAIDLPSGLCSDTGRPLGRVAATARVTYCLGLLKQGLLQDPALRHVGRLVRIDLNLPGSLLEGLPAGQPLAVGGESAAADLASLPLPEAEPAAAKYGRGRLLVIAGSTAYRGAAALALAGASGSGVGSLRACLPRELAESLWQSLPHVVVQEALPATAAGGLALAPPPPELLARLDAVVLGPGLGQAAAAAEGGAQARERACWEALEAFAGLLVLDADGLNRLGDPGWMARRAGPTWITPHHGEFARLFPDLAPLPPLEAALRAAERAGCTVLLKGARTVVAAPDGRRWQLRRAWPEAARAGMGDVLAGLAGGLGARAWGTGLAPEALPPLLAGSALVHAEAAGLVVHRHGAEAAAPAAVAQALPEVMKVKKSP